MMKNNKDKTKRIWFNKIKLNSYNRKIYIFRSSRSALLEKQKQMLLNKYKMT
jgi:hypothetical protein